MQLPLNFRICMQYFYSLKSMHCVALHLSFCMQLKSVSEIVAGFDTYSLQEFQCLGSAGRDL